MAKKPPKVRKDSKMSFSKVDYNIERTVKAKKASSRITKSKAPKYKTADQILNNKKKR